MGNRIEKIVKGRNAGVIKSAYSWKHTYYVRDAQGQIVAIYDRNNEESFNGNYYLFCFDMTDWIPEMFMLFTEGMDPNEVYSNNVIYTAGKSPRDMALAMAAVINSNYAQSPKMIAEVDGNCIKIYFDGAGNLAELKMYGIDESTIPITSIFFEGQIGSGILNGSHTTLKVSEHTIYGSSRLGIHESNQLVFAGHINKPDNGPDINPFNDHLLVSSISIQPMNVNHRAFTYTFTDQTKPWQTAGVGSLLLEVKEFSVPYSVKNSLFNNATLIVPSTRIAQVNYLAAVLNNLFASNNPDYRAYTLHSQDTSSLVIRSINSFKFVNYIMADLICTDNSFNQTYNNAYWYPNKHKLFTYHTGHKSYELTNHLGNVNIVVGDRVILESLGIKDYGKIFASNAGITAGSASSTTTANFDVKVTANQPNNGAGAIIPFSGLIPGSACVITVGIEAGYDKILTNSSSFVAGQTGFTLATGSGISPAAQTSTGLNGISLVNPPNSFFLELELPFTPVAAVGQFHLSGLPLNLATTAEYAIKYIHIRQTGYTRHALLKQSTDYYPFGNPMPGRVFQGGSGYRYGHGGQEKDDEISGSGNSYTAMFWQYSPRLGVRWNRDPITYPWHSPYVVFNDNPIAFNDPLGLFGSRKEARAYKKESGVSGRIHKGDNGIFSIDHKKSNTSYFKDPSTDGIENLIGRQEDGVIKSTLISPDETSSPSAGHYLTGIGKFGEKGEKATLGILKDGELKFYEKWKGNQHVKTEKVFGKGLTKIAKKAPLIGNIITASEIIDGIQADGNAIGANTAVEVAGAIGGAGGGWAGAAIGATIGTAILPGVGTAIGGGVGAVLGSWGGEAGAEYGTKAKLNE
jgi:hypothetical protein